MAAARQRRPQRQCDGTPVLEMGVRVCVCYVVCRIGVCVCVCAMARRVNFITLGGVIADTPKKLGALCVQMG